MSEIHNPFKQSKKLDWAKKAQEKHKEIITKTTPIKKNIKIERIAKSFKVYKSGDIIKNFDKRVNKLQVVFDDLDMPKDYVDSGKYLMFLMQFAEKYNIYELYSEVNTNGEFTIDSKKLKEFITKLK